MVVPNIGVSAIDEWRSQNRSFICCPDKDLAGIYGFVSKVPVAKLGLREA